MHTDTDTDTDTDTHTHTHTTHTHDTHTRTHARTHARARAHTHNNTHTRTHARAHTHTLSLRLSHVLPEAFKVCHTALTRPQPPGQDTAIYSELHGHVAHLEDVGKVGFSPPLWGLSWVNVPPVAMALTVMSATRST
jgi:hypothetical protein